MITFWGNDRALNKWYPTDPMKRERLEEALRPPPGCMTSQQVAKIFCQDARPHLPIHDQKGGAVIASANRLRAAINREGGLMKASVAEQYVTRHVRGGLNLKQWLEKYPEFGIVWNHRDHKGAETISITKYVPASSAHGDSKSSPKIPLPPGSALQCSRWVDPLKVPR